MHPTFLSEIARQRLDELVRDATERRNALGARRTLVAHREPARGWRRFFGLQPLGRGAFFASVEDAPLFRGLGRRELALLSRKADSVRYEAGATLVRETEPRPEFFLITCGIAEALRGGRRIALLRAGDHFGEQAVLDAAPSVPTLRAVTDVDAFVLDRRDFREVVQHVPVFGLRLMTRMAAELERARA